MASHVPEAVQLRLHPVQVLQVVAVGVQLRAVSGDHLGDDVGGPVQVLVRPTALMPFATKNFGGCGKRTFRASQDFNLSRS